MPNAKKLIKGDISFLEVCYLLLFLYPTAQKRDKQKKLD